MRNNLKFSEKTTKWKALEHPLKESVQLALLQKNHLTEALIYTTYFIYAIYSRPCLTKIISLPG